MNPYAKVSVDISSLVHQHLLATAALHIFEAFRKARSPKHNGKRKLKANIDVLTEYKYLFGPTEEAFRFLALLELAKLFDKDPRARSLTNVLAYIEAQATEFTADNFFTYRDSIGESTADHLKQYFKTISRADILKMKRSLKTLSPIVKKLLRYRHTALAHVASDYKDVAISAGETKRMFNTVQRILDTLSSKILWSHTMRESYMRDSETDVRRVISDLYDYHKLRGARIPQLRR